MNIVTFFTSNYKFEARGCTIIAIQDSQGEIPGLTSKFWNFPLGTLNCNDKNFVLLVAVVLLQSICETLNNIPHKYFHLTRGVPLRMWNYVSSANTATPVLYSFYTLVPTKNKLRFFVPHILVHDSGKLLETANHKFCSFSSFTPWISNFHL